MTLVRRRRPRRRTTRPPREVAVRQGQGHRTASASCTTSASRSTGSSPRAPLREGRSAQVRGCGDRESPAIIDADWARAEAVDAGPRGSRSRAVAAGRGCLQLKAAVASPPSAAQLQPERPAYRAGSITTTMVSRAWRSSSRPRASCRVDDTRRAPLPGVLPDGDSRSTCASWSIMTQAACRATCGASPCARRTDVRRQRGAARTVRTGRARRRPGRAAR